MLLFHPTKVTRRDTPRFNLPDAMCGRCSQVPSAGRNRSESNLLGPRMELSGAQTSAGGFRRLVFQ
jgi:hypothetical protein